MFEKIRTEGRTEDRKRENAASYCVAVLHSWREIIVVVESAELNLRGKVSDEKCKPKLSICQITESVQT